MNDYVFDSETAMRLYFDGRLEPDELIHLSNWIRENPSNARTFARQAALHNQLRSVLLFQAASLVDARSSIRLNFVRGVAAAAVFIVLAGGFALYRWRLSTAMPPEQSLASGLKSLQLENGVTLLIEGPARYRIVSPLEVRLSSGKLSAKVPENARGFTVLTPSARIVDLGTEFGVYVRPDGSVHSEVFSGRVELHALNAGPNGYASIILTREQAADVFADSTTVNAGVLAPGLFRREASAPVAAIPSRNDPTPETASSKQPQESHDTPPEPGQPKTDATPFKLPMNWNGEAVGEPYLATATGEKAFWRMEQIWPDNFMKAENYIPLTWDGAAWVAKEHGQGGAPKIRISNGVAQLSALSKWRGPDLEHNKYPALSFVAPKKGVFTISGKASANPWEGNGKVYKLLLLKNAVRQIAKLTEVELPRDGRWVPFSVTMELSAGEKVIFLPSIYEYHNSVMFAVSDLTIQESK